MKGKLLTIGIIVLLCGLLTSCAAPTPAASPPTPIPPPTSAPAPTAVPPTPVPPPTATAAPPTPAPTATSAPASTAATPAASQPAPIALVNAFIAAMNRCALDDALAMFTDDSVYAVAVQTSTGKSQVRTYLEYMDAIRMRVTQTDCKMEGEQAVCMQWRQDDSMVAYGFTGVRLKFVYSFKDGKIQQAIGAPEGPEWPAYSAMSKDATAWMAANRADEWKKVSDEKGALIRNGQTGPIIMKLAREYAKTKQAAPASTDLIGLANAYVAAANRRDVEGALALFNEDAELTLAVQTATGKSQIRTLLEYMDGIGMRMAHSDCKLTGELAVCSQWRQDEPMTALGFAGVRFKFAYTMRDGKLQTVVGTVDGPEFPAYSAASKDAMTWMAASRPDEWKKVSDDKGALVRAAQTAPLIVKLVREYAGEKAKAGAAQPFPAGVFDVKPYQGIQGGLSLPKKIAYTFKEDGTYTIAGHGFALGSGKATVNGDQIALVGKFLDTSCPDQEGVYKWAFDGKSLSFTAVKDPCNDRRIGLTGGAVKRAATAAAPLAIEKLPNIGTTKSLTILPLIDIKGLASFKAEGGVSYLIKTDEATILLDMGANRKNEDPSPFEANMQQLGIKWSDIDAIAFSHQHYDHTGGLQWQFTDTFAPGLKQIDLGGKPVYVPTQLSYPGLTPIVATLPLKIAKAVASIGTLPMTPPGDGPEQILAVNVEGKGIVLITGCGHPTVPKIVERARLVFDEPIVGIVGGLHYPEKDAKLIQERMDFLKSLNLQIVALSPHDSSEEAQAAVLTAFVAAAKEIKVGQPIAFGQ